jgi:hypothetical protein
VALGGNLASLVVLECLAFVVEALVVEELVEVDFLKVFNNQNPLNFVLEGLLEYHLQKENQNQKP